MEPSSPLLEYNSRCRHIWVQGITHWHFHHSKPLLCSPRVSGNDGWELDFLNSSTSAGLLPWLRFCLWDVLKWVLGAKESYFSSGSAGEHMALATCYQWCPCSPDCQGLRDSCDHCPWWFSAVSWPLGGGNDFLILRITALVIKLEANGCPFALTYAASPSKTFEST